MNIVIDKQVRHSQVSDSDLMYHQELDGNSMSFICSAVAALGGGLHGYHNAIMSGIITRQDFISEFYPELLKQPGAANQYCQYNSQRLSLLTSSLFAMTIIAESTGLPAFFTRRWGRKRMMIVSGVLFAVSSICQTAATSIAMLITGRCFAGVALSCSTVSVLLYISEVSPAKSRGRNGQLFQLQLTFFIFLANMFNLATANHHGFWRLTTGFGLIPAVMFAVAGCYLPDSPSSLMERGHLMQGRVSLAKLRSNTSSESALQKEAAELFASGERARRCKSTWQTFLQRSHRPQLILVTLSTLFQQFTGINFVIFYGPQLFLQLGKSVHTASWLALVISVVNHLSAYLSFWWADRLGRRPLLLTASIPMLLGLIGIGTAVISAATSAALPWIVFSMVCLFDIGYGCSWGPIGWLYPTEIQDLATRPCGITIASLVNVFFSFLMAQLALEFLCALKFGVFFFFAGCIVVITVAVFYLFPETKHVPVEQAHRLFRRHPIWKGFVNAP